MYLKLSVVLLSVVCLGQLPQAFARDPSTAAELKVFPHLFLVVLDNAKNVSENILAKAMLVRRKSDELKKFMPGFARVTAGVTALHKQPADALENLFMVTSIYSQTEYFFNLTGNYSESMRTHPSAFPANLALDNNGFQSFRATFEKAMRDFTPQFVAQKEEDIAALTMLEKRQNRKFIQNFNLFKNERDVDRRFVYLKPFVTYNP